MNDTVANAFIGRTEEPDEAGLAAALGPAKPVWDALVAGLAAQQGVTVREWSNYSVKTGWSLRLKRGKRTIVWLSPCSGCFQVTFILGDKALLAAAIAAFPPARSRLSNKPRGTRKVPESGCSSRVRQRSRPSGNWLRPSWRIEPGPATPPVSRQVWLHQDASLSSNSPSESI